MSLPNSHSSSFANRRPRRIESSAAVKATKPTSDSLIPHLANMQAVVDHELAAEMDKQLAKAKEEAHRTVRAATQANASRAADQLQSNMPSSNDMGWYTNRWIAGARDRVNNLLKAPIPPVQVPAAPLITYQQVRDSPPDRRQDDRFWEDITRGEVRAARRAMDKKLDSYSDDEDWTIIERHDNDTDAEKKAHISRLEFHIRQTIGRFNILKQQNPLPPLSIRELQDLHAKKVELESKVEEIKKELESTEEAKKAKADEKEKARKRRVEEEGWTKANLH